MDVLKNQLLFILSTPLYVVLIALELCISHFQGTRSYSLKDTAHNFYLSLLRGGVELLTRGVSLIVLSAAFYYRLFSPEQSFFYWCLLLLSVDFMHYWLHRASHFCRFFWAVHVNHHSSPHYNISVGFRSAVLEPFYNFLFLTPLALAGFRPADIILVYAITEIWAVLTHTEKVKKLGWLEYIMNTPSHHRVHHASNPKYLDKNMGSLFIFWDKLFGTFQKELPPDAYQSLKYGLTSPLANEKLPHLVFHEWAAILADLRRKDITWKDRWLYLFGPPGWSHDSTRMTSEQMRQQENDESKKNLKQGSPVLLRRNAMQEKQQI
ncbi:MAG: sterol desaturase family protein [Chitinophagaceae bacterium]|nr:sterol desaturase family protein [Chitinophagaceae bacterium]